MPYANLKERMAEEAARHGILLAELAAQVETAPLTPDTARQIQVVLRLSVLFTPAALEHHWGIPAAQSYLSCKR